MSNSIPGYQIIKKAGTGGMSTVYLSIQLSVGREVALKVLSPELREDPHFSDRFYREANIVGRLSHPNIVSIYDIFKHENQFCMAMDYLPSDSCKERIRKHSVTPLDALRIIKQVADGLKYIHEHNYIHCDIKPDNILFRANGQAVITDFGIARELPDQKNQHVSGTPYYMSPEQAQGHKLDVRSDIYSLGVVLYELLTFQLPFKGKDPIAIAIKHVSSPIPQLPEELHALTPLLTKLMAKRPGARFQNCNEVIHAVDFIESQYLKQQNTQLPLKLKVAFALQKVQNTLKKFSIIHSKLHCSLRHGLVLKNHLIDANGESLTEIAKNVEKAQTLNTDHTTLSLAELTHDSIAIALATDQAKSLLPPTAVKVSLIILGVILVASLGYVGFEIWSNHYGKPNIIYID